MYKLLIVEDEKWVKERLCKTIDWKSYDIIQVSSASNGQEAYECIMENGFDIVITDVRMPVCSGLELIRRVRQQGLDTHFIIISGYADFEYAKQAMQMQVIDYITKPVEDKELIQCVLNCQAAIEAKHMQTQEVEHLKEQWDMGKEALEDKLYQELLNGNITEMETLNYLQEKTGLCLSYQYYGCIVLDTNLFLTRTPTAENMLHDFTCALKKHLKQYEELNLLFITAIQNRLICILGTNLSSSGLTDTLPLLYQAMEQLFSTCFHHSIAIGAGNFYQTPLGLHTSLTQAVASLQYHIYSRQSIVSDMTESKDLSFALLGIDCSAVDAIALHISNGNREEAARSIHKLTADFPPEQTPSDYQLLAFKVTNDMINRLLSLGISAEVLSNVPILYLDYFSRIHSAEDAASLILSICSSIIKSLAYSTEKKQSKIMTNILEYINRNYTLPITSKAVAEEFYFNPSYFSSMFKENMGTSFTKYVTNLRITKSKEMLRRTNSKINDIAQNVGYDDVQYFIKIFKSSTGTSPGSYRDSYS